MANTLIAIDEGMIRHEGKAQGCSFLDDRGVEVCTAKGGGRLCQGGFEQAKIANPGCPAGLCKHPPVKVNDLTEREVSH